MKNLALLNLMIFSSLIGFCQIPTGYYNSAQGLGGVALKTALYNIIKGNVAYQYTTDTTDVWDILKQTDKDPNNPNNVILIYSGLSVNAAQEWNNGNGWEREHVWAKSRGNFGTATGPGTDVHHLRPVNSSSNSKRNNRWFAECSEPYILNGVPTGSYFSSTSWVWKPRNEVKGDVARMIFYMATRYEGFNGEPDLNLVDYFPADNSQGPEFALLSDLLAWNAQDPVSQWEIDRNNIIYGFQHNRNPFIDHPEWVECIWNNNCSGFWFSSYPNKTLTDRDTYSYTITANGSTADVLTISAVTVPTWLTFTANSSAAGSATATLSGTPTFSDIGTHTVSLKLSNSTTNVFQDYQIIVSDGNPIAFTSTPVTQVNSNAIYTYNITTTGDPGATFTITGTTLPTWLSLTNNIGATATLTGTPNPTDVGTNAVTLTLSDGTPKIMTQTFNIQVTDPNAPQVIISQYYEGVSNNKYIEITNIGNAAVDLSTYYLARWGTTATPSGPFTNGDMLSGTIAAGQTQVYKNANAANPVYAVTGAISNTTATYYNGDDPVALLNGGTDWTNRVDCIYAPISSGFWGAEKGFYRKANVMSGNKNISALDGSDEWVSISIAQADNAQPLTSEYLGYHIYTPVSVKSLSNSTKIYPIPATDNLFFETQTSVKQIEVISVTGKSLIKQAGNGTKNRININQLTHGMYLLKVTDIQNQISFHKFIK